MLFAFNGNKKIYIPGFTKNKDIVDWSKFSDELKLWCISSL